MATRYLSIEEIIFIHDRVLVKTSGSSGIRDLTLLLSAVDRPRASFGGSDLYPNPYLKAAALFHSLILNHSFIDGNKRTAFISVFRFLEINGIKLKVNKKEIIKFCLEVENKEHSLKEIAEWLRKHSEKSEDE